MYYFAYFVSVWVSSNFEIFHALSDCKLRCKCERLLSIYLFNNTWNSITFISQTHLIKIYIQKMSAAEN